MSLARASWPMFGVLGGVLFLSGPRVQAQDARFIRGDTNGDGIRNMSDAIHTLAFLFNGGPESTCLDAADTNDDGRLDLSDGVALLAYLFLGAKGPPAPGGACGFDPTGDVLGCAELVSCPQPVISFEIVDGLAVAEGDIVLGDPEDVPVVGPEGAGGGFAVGERILEGFTINGWQIGKRWPDAVIPYRFADDERRPSTATGLAILQAMGHWQHLTRIRFVPRTNHADYITFQGGPSDGSCGNSRVGRQGGEQFVWIADGCGMGTAVHEIGHAVGLWHEQTREDRDQFIEIQWNNISWRWRGNFQRKDGVLLGPYDFDSIMHYSAVTGFEKPGCTGCLSIRTLDPANQNRIGQRNGLSAGDIAAVEQLYGSPRTVTWSDWARLGPADGRGSAIAVGSNQDGRLEVFVRGVPGDGLWHLWQQDAEARSWAPQWHFLGGILDSRFQVVTSQQGLLNLFVEGVDRRVYQISQTAPNSGWGDWQALTPPNYRLLGAGNGPAGTLHLLLIGLTARIEELTSANAWGGLSYVVGSRGARAGACLTDSFGLLNVFAIGDPDNDVFGASQFRTGASSFAWSIPSGLAPGFSWADGIAAFTNLNGTSVVCVRGSDRALWMCQELTPRGTWSGWTSLGGTLSSPRIAGARNGQGRLEVFAIGEKDVLLHTWQQAPNGSSGWAAFESFDLTVRDLDVGLNADGRVEVFAVTPGNEVFHRWLKF